MINFQTRQCFVRNVGFKNNFILFLLNVKHRALSAARILIHIYFSGSLKSQENLAVPTG